MSATAVMTPAAAAKSRAERTRAEVRITSDTGWHLLRSMRTGGQPAWRQMLAANSALPPRLKYALVPEDWSVELRAECLASEESLADSCAASLSGEGTPSVEDGRSAEQPVSAEDWIHLCESAGWKAEMRANNSVVVPLPSGRHIRIEASGSAMRAVVEFGEIAKSDSPSARARELLLLTLAHEVRMIRPLLRGRAAGTHTLAEIEAGFPRKPEAEELNHALAALAVATSACAEVFDALGDEDLASRYLAIRQPRNRPPV